MANFALGLPSLNAGPPPLPTCSPSSSVCDEENFSAYSPAPIVYLGTSFTSPNGFYFERSVAGQFQVHNLSNIGNTLYVPGHTSFFVLPTLRETVALQISGTGRFEFAAYDNVGVHLESFLVDIFNESRTVVLSPGQLIKTVFVHHLDSDPKVCSSDYWEPFITSILACDS